MASMQQLFNDGKLGVVQSVSYPKPNFSHFRATDIWMTGSDSDKVVSSGWAGRFLHDVFPQFPDNFPNEAMPDPLAIQVGSVVSTALQGPLFTMGMAISNPAGFYKLVEGKVNVNANARWGEQLDYIELMSQKTDQYATVIKNAAQKVPAQSPAYPAAGKNPLADQLKIVARLIAGGLKTKVYMVSTGSFDTHAKQTETDTTTGTHAKLLQRVSEAVGAFMSDLQFLQIENRVMGMTFSEFGRRIKSNASGGTDHGAAAPVLDPAAAAAAAGAAAAWATGLGLVPTVIFSVTGLTATFSETMVRDASRPSTMTSLNVFSFLPATPAWVTDFSPTRTVASSVVTDSNGTSSLVTAVCPVSTRETLMTMLLTTGAVAGCESRSLAPRLRPASSRTLPTVAAVVVAAEALPSATMLTLLGVEMET
jgi:hypothetical protein